MIGEDTVAMSGLHSWVACVDGCYRAGRARNTVTALVRMLAALGAFGVTHGYWPADSEPWGSARRRRDVLRSYRWDGEAEGDGGITLDEVPSWRDIEKLAAAMEERTGQWRYGAAVIVAAASGVRQCELLALRVEDLHLDAGTIRIERQIDRYQLWPAVTTPKRNKKRITIFWAHVRPVLERLVEEAIDGWLFAPPPGVTRWADMFGHRLDDASVAAGFDWPAHYLRHHFASVSLAPRDAGGYGLDVADVSRWLGHSSSRTTMDTYRQPQSGSAAAARGATSQPPH
jgi:integrase